MVEGSADPRRMAVAIIGAGPRGTSVLERLVANAEELLPGVPVDMHVLDPHPPGGGKVWRQEQPPLLWANTRMDECTLFTDDSVSCAGPIRPGPTLEEWAQRIARDDLRWPASFSPHPESLTEASQAHAGWFPTRRLIGDYLSWVFWRAAEGTRQVRVASHQSRALDIIDLPSGRQRVVLAGNAEIDVDLVVHAQGHLDVRAVDDDADLAREAMEHGLVFLPRALASDVDLDPVRPSEPVIVQGLGLAFMDLMVLLTEGRGGHFVRAPSGELRYEPCGLEPVIYAGSRRGLPFRSKFSYSLRDEAIAAPRYLGEGALGTDPLDFTHDLWPQIARELTTAGYRELACSHPERLAMEASEFLDRLHATAWNSPDFASLIDKAVTCNEDRVEVDRLDQFLDGRTFGTHAELQQWMTDYLSADLKRGRDPRQSPHLAVYHSMLELGTSLQGPLEAGQISPGHGTHSLQRFFDFCRFRTSGAPSARIEQLLALAHSGHVQFLGGGTNIILRNGEFQARSSSVDRVVTARALIDARLPPQAISLVKDPLLLRLKERGSMREHTAPEPGTGRRRPTGVLDVRDGHPIRSDGRAHRMRFVTGPRNFPHPGKNALFLRQSDSLARKVLQRLQALEPHPQRTEDAAEGHSFEG